MEIVAVKNRWKVFWAYLLFYLSVYYLLIFLLQKVVFTDSFYFNNMSNQFSEDRLKTFIRGSRMSDEVTYFTLPIIILIKIGLTSTVLFAGALFKGIKLTFKATSLIVLHCESVFVLQGCVKLMYMLLFGANLDTAMKMNSIFSINYIIGGYKQSNYFNYLLNSINIFEIAYALMLIYFFRKNTQLDLRRASTFVLQTYGIGMAVWTLFVTFLALQFS